MFKRIIAWSFIVAGVALIALLSCLGPDTSFKKALIRMPAGSGSIVQAPSGRHFVLSNWHVCTVSITGHKVAVKNYGKEFITKIVRVSVDADLCALPAPLSLPYLKVAPHFDTHSGKEDIRTIGYPEGNLKESQGLIIDVGRVTILGDAIHGACVKGFYQRFVDVGAFVCLKEYPEYFTTLYSRPGASGSPVVNSSGELIGVVQAYDFLGQAGVIPLEVIKNFLKDL